MKIKFIIDPPHKDMLDIWTKGVEYDAVLTDALGYDAVKFRADKGDKTFVKMIYLDKWFVIMNEQNKDFIAESEV